MIKIFTASVISFSMGVAIAYFGVVDNAQDVIDKSVSVPAVKIQSGNLQALAVYTDYIRQLEELNRQLTMDLQAARSAQLAISDKSSQGQLQAKLDSATFEDYCKARKNSDDFSQYLQRVSADNSVGYVKDLAAKFDAEVVDTQWASDYESRLYSLFGSDGLSGSVVPQSIACKSRRCQIKVAIGDIEHANQVMQSFSAAINNNQLSIDKSMVVSAPDVNEGVVSLYLARDVNVKIYE